MPKDLGGDRTIARPAMVLAARKCEQHSDDVAIKGCQARVVDDQFGNHHKRIAFLP
jgi:hypothetical protein